MKAISSKDKKALKIVAIVSLFIALGLGLLWGNRYLDSRRFATADDNAQVIFTSLIQNIGTPIQTENSKVCYNTEQGPWDNGRLWCQVAAVAFFSLDAPPSSIDDTFAQVAEASDLQLVDKRAANLEFLGAENLPCEVEFNTGEFAGNPTHYLPSNQDAKQILIVRCSDRAKAQHYPRAD